MSTGSKNERDVVFICQLRELKDNQCVSDDFYTEQLCGPIMPRLFEILSIPDALLAKEDLVRQQGLQ